MVTQGFFHSQIAQSFGGQTLYVHNVHCLDSITEDRKAGGAIGFNPQDDPVDRWAGTKGCLTPIKGGQGHSRFMLAVFVCLFSQSLFSFMGTLVHVFSPVL